MSAALLLVASKQSSSSNKQSRIPEKNTSSTVPAAAAAAAAAGKYSADAVSFFCVPEQQAARRDAAVLPAHNTETHIIKRNNNDKLLAVRFAFRTARQRTTCGINWRLTFIACYSTFAPSCFFTEAKKTIQPRAVFSKQTDKFSHTIKLFSFCPTIDLKNY